MKHRKLSSQTREAPAKNAERFWKKLHDIIPSWHVAAGVPMAVARAKPCTIAVNKSEKTTGLSFRVLVSVHFETFVRTVRSWGASCSCPHPARLLLPIRGVSCSRGAQFSSTSFVLSVVGFLQTSTTRSWVNNLGREVFRGSHGARAANTHWNLAERYSVYLVLAAAILISNQCMPKTQMSLSRRSTNPLHVSMSNLTLLSQVLLPPRSPGLQPGIRMRQNCAGQTPNGVRPPGVPRTGRSWLIGDMLSFLRDAIPLSIMADLT
jgi:hypothetical protein